jgi:hypothetical protein
MNPISKKSSSETQSSSRATSSGASARSGGRRNTNTNSSIAVGSENDSSGANYYSAVLALSDYEQDSIQTAEACAVGVISPDFAIEAGDIMNTVQDDSSSPDHGDDTSSQSMMQQSSLAPSIPSAAA